MDSPLAQTAHSRLPDYAEERPRIVLIKGVDVLVAEGTRLNLSGDETGGVNYTLHFLQREEEGGDGQVHFLLLPEGKSPHRGTATVPPLLGNVEALGELLRWDWVKIAPPRWSNMVKCWTTHELVQYVLDELVRLNAPMLFIDSWND